MVKVMEMEMGMAEVMVEVIKRERGGPMDHLFFTFIQQKPPTFISRGWNVKRVYNSVGVQTPTE
ncbi:hypothetical protein [Fredinandcohnia sp. 179-A 10B2 NHS]|uniref:hypothetical protein n=1 Tax=Fredinandcohnia sp. 179-A 10B2 NHS TaxID=3235176 RepID=UPI0039A2A02A